MSAVMPGWLARRAGAELDWGIRFLLGRAPLGQNGARMLTQAGGAADKADPQSLAARATRLAAAWPGMGGRWAEGFDDAVRDRLAKLIWLAGDLKQSHGTATTWRPDDETSPVPTAGAA